MVRSRWTLPLRVRNRKHEDMHLLKRVRRLLLLLLLPVRFRLSVILVRVAPVDCDDASNDRGCMI